MGLLGYAKAPVVGVADDDGGFQNPTDSGGGTGGNTGGNTGGSTGGGAGGGSTPVDGAGSGGATPVVDTGAGPIQGPGPKIYLPAAADAPAASAINYIQRAKNQGRLQDAADLDLLARVPYAVWFGGYSGEDAKIARTIAACKATGATLVCVSYYVPGRDNGNYSRGGAPNPDAYKTWVDKITRALKGDVPVRLILEPDALAQGQANATKQAERNQALAYAVNTFTSAPNIRVYVDGGTPGWQSVGTMVNRINALGTKRFTGVMVNNANHRWTDESATFAKNILVGLGHSGTFMVDVSRNGRGNYIRNPATESSDITWCNCGAKGSDGTVYATPRGLGVPPTLAPGIARCDGLVWSKIVGQSDGEFPPGSPVPGAWMEELALTTIRNRVKQSAPTGHDLGVPGWTV